MKKVIERMNAGIEEQALRKLSSPSSASFPSTSSKESKDKEKQQKKWFIRRTSGAVGKDDKASAAGAGTGGEEDVEGMRVDWYLVVFLKFIASIVPTIEVDSTASM